MTKTFFADNYLFHVEHDEQTDLYDVGVLNQVFIYSGPPGAHRKVLYDAIQILVKEGKLGEEILDVPIGSYQEVGPTHSGVH